MEPGPKEAQQRFIEEVGLLFEQWSLPRMAGRILGWLLICDPPHQSAAQLAERVGASKGSISTNTRLLIQSGFMERIGLPGDRNTYYQLVEQPINRIIQAEMASISAIRRMAERGLELIGDGNPPQRARLSGLVDMWKFFEREFPRLAERYERERAERQKAERQKEG